MSESPPFDHDHDAAILSEPVAFPCGRIAPNRLVKAAMYESLANFGGGSPNEKHFKLYSKWGSGGWGMIITGNVQIDQRHLSLGRDIVVPERPSIDAIGSFRTLARSARRGNSDTLVVMQLNHTGRQAPRIVGGQGISGHPDAPSAVRMQSRNPVEGFISRLCYAWLFSRPEPLTGHGVQQVIDHFVRGAVLAFEAGFDGVQLHASHGYLLAQFLSPKTNLRSDCYGFPNELEIVEQIAGRIRENVPKTFVLGIKLNAGDYMAGSLDEDHALEHVRKISSWRLFDFIEISGGDYEQPDFARKANPRQAFFSSFSRKAFQVLPNNGGETPMIMLTGSMRKRSLMASTIRQNHAHLIGIGRPAVICPSLPEALLSIPGAEAIAIPAAPKPTWLWFLNTGLIGAGVDTAWHCALMWRIGNGVWTGVKPSHIDSIGLVQGSIPGISGLRSLFDLWRT